MLMPLIFSAIFAVMLLLIIYAAIAAMPFSYYYYYADISPPLMLRHAAD